MKKFLTGAFAVIFILNTAVPAMAADETPATPPETEVTAPAVETAPTESIEEPKTEEDLLMEEKPVGPEEGESQALTSGESDINSPNVATTIKQKLAEVDQNSGALNYTYPIVVPLGRNGLQPDLTLTYNNQSAEDVNLFGYGWSLNIPYIERLNKNGTDKLYTRSDFSSSLSGELVDLGSGNFGSKVDNSEFLTYSLAGNFWTVKDKKGTIYKFGTTAAERQDNPGDSTQIFKWTLQEVRDTNDNFIRYEYYKDSGQIYPSRIVYTGNGVADGAFEVNFVRSGRNDNLKSYKTGFLVQSNYRITEINTTVSSFWVRKYALGYATGDNGLRSMLSTITESGRDEALNIITLPATIFTYQVSTVGWDMFTTPWAVPENISEHHNFIDVNGDSLQDIIKSYNDPINVINKGTYINSNFLWTLNPGLEPPILFEKREVRGGAYERIWDNGARLIDVNGDQFTDIIQGLDVYPGYTGSNFTAYLNNTGTSWVQDQSWSPTIGFTQTSGSDPYGGGGSIGDYGSRVMELNGDGLPDLTRQSSGDFLGTQLNSGSGFSSVVSNWNTPVNLKEPQTKVSDVNNDGLTDVTYSTWDYFYLRYNEYSYLNTGIGNWIDEPSLKTPIHFTGSPGPDPGVRNLDVNGDGLVDFVIDPFNDTGGDRHTWLGTGVGWSSRPEWVLPTQDTYFMMGYDHSGDFNQDGLVDFIHFVNNSSQETDVYIHRGVEPDLLSKITYATGGFTDVTYQKSAKYKDGSGNVLNPNLPLNLTTVKTLTHNNGNGTTSTDTYSYEGGKYYYGGPFDRKLAGFAKIKKTDAAGNVSTTFFHQGDTSNSSQGEYNDEMWKIGKPYRIEVASSSGSVFSKTINKWDSFDLGNGRKFVKLAQTLEQSLDGNASHKDKAVANTYDNANGNLTQQIQYGEVTGSDDGTFTDTGSDKLTTTTTYASNVGANILGLPSQDTTVDQSSNKVRESMYYYDLQTLGNVLKGNLTKKEDWKTGSTYINSQKTYDGTYGLVTVDTDPRGKTTNYVYDSFNLYPATVTNHLNQATQYLYDYSLGKPKQVTDPNTRVFQTVYDGFDRVVEEKQPDIASPGTLVTKSSYVYTDTALAVSVKKTDFLDGSSSVDSYTYFDGFGRPTQTRAEAEAANIFAIKDTIYNNLGQVGSESLPYFSTGSAKTSATIDTNLLATFSYDPLMRITSTQNAVGTVSNAYDDWKVAITDARGKPKNLYKDAFDNLVKVEEFNNAATYTTLYEYNGNKNLTKITDALGNIRNFTYDGLGRRLTAQDLHASADATFGSWSYTYDDAGNLTQVIDPKNQTINYTFDDLNRKSTEDFTGQAGTEVTYTYDVGVDGKGRLTSVTNSAVTETNTYNALGLLKTQSSNITGGSNYQTTYDYDRLGHQVNITNPDGSQVKNLYNSAGLLNQVQRKETTDGSFINVVSNLDYGPHGKITTQNNANGTTTTNTYDATKLYRLSNKTTSGSSNFQNLSYSYDNNGNVTQIVDNSATNSKKTVNYTYDDLNRLLTSSASNVAAGQQTYSHNFTYDAVGNILTRVETIGAGSPVTYTYAYAGNQGASYANPHAVTSISDGTTPTNFTYDNNGNMTAEGSKTYTFDYNNRLTQAVVPSGGGGSSTTTPYSSYAGDGSIVFNSSNSWSTAHDAATGSSVTTGNTLKVNSGKASANKFTIERGFIPFDTSSLPANASITSAKLKVFVDSKSDSDNDGDDWVTVVQSTQPSTSSLGTPDYDLAGSVNNPTEGIDTSERKDITNVTTGQYLEFNLNTTGLSWIVKGGATKLALREGHDVINSAYSGGNNSSNQLVIRAGEYAGTTSDPVLEVTYTTPPPATTVTYAYDEGGQRVKYGNGISTTFYPSAEYNIDNSGTQQKHIFADGLDLGTVKGTGGSAAMHFTHTDHLTGASVVTDITGAQEELMDYFPYGSMRLDEKTGTFSEQRKFTGQEFDVDTGLNYMNARYYNPSTGRFLSQDKVFLSTGDPAVSDITGLSINVFLSDPQSLNSYSYARNNPLIYTDPTGHFWKQVKALWSGAANAVASNNTGIPRGSGDNYYQTGQTIGDLLSLIQGSYEAAAGIVAMTGGAAGGVATSPTGVGALAGAGVSAAGVAATVHGTGVARSATANLMSGKGKGSSNEVRVNDRIEGSRVTKHAADQARDRGVNADQVSNALKNGKQYYDTKNDSILWVIGENGKGGYSVATTADKQTLKTVQNFVPNLNSGNGTRFIKIGP